MQPDYFEGQNFQDYLFRILFRMLVYMFALYLFALVMVGFLCLIWPPLWIIPVTLVITIIATFRFRHEVMDFTWQFYVSGHWKKEWREYFRPRRPEEVAPHNFKRLKRIAFAFMIAPSLIWIADVLVIVDQIPEDRQVPAMIGYGIVAAFPVFVHLFFGYWALRGANFQSRFTHF